MAYNEISLPKWQDLVRRRFGLTGPGGNVPVVASEIQPVVIVEPALPEHEVLRGTTHYLRSIFRTIANAQRGAVGLVNPVGSGKIVVVDRVWGALRWLTTAPAYPVGVPEFVLNNENLNPLVTGYAAGPVTAIPTDQRRWNTPSAAQLWNTSAANPIVGASVVCMLPFRADDTGAAVPLEDSDIKWDFIVPAPYVLLPGFSVIVVAGPNANTNNVMIVGYSWYEQNAETQENRG